MSPEIELIEKLTTVIYQLACEVNKLNQNLSFLNEKMSDISTAANKVSLTGSIANFASNLMRGNQQRG